MLGHYTTPPRRGNDSTVVAGRQEDVRLFHRRYLSGWPTPGDKTNRARKPPMRLLAEVTGVEYATVTRDGQGLAGMALFPAYYLGPFAPAAPAPAAAPRLPQQRP